MSMFKVKIKVFSLFFWISFFFRSYELDQCKNEQIKTCSIIQNKTLTKSKVTKTKPDVIQINSSEDKNENYDLSIDPKKWTVSQVGEFISYVTDDRIGNIFFKFDINGRALLLLTKEILRNDMKINLGPSIIILNEIAKLRQHEHKFNS